MLPNIVEGLDRITVEDDTCLIEEIAYMGWGRFEQALAPGLGPHRHVGSYEICYLAQGQVTWWIENRVYEVKRGEVFITKPGEFHGGSRNVMHPCELNWIQVRFDLHDSPGPPAADGELVTLSRDLSAVKHRAFPAPESIKHHLARILSEHRAPSRHATLLVRSTLYELIIDLLRAHETFDRLRDSNTSEVSAKVAQAMQWMEERLALPCKVEEIAKAVSMSASYFYQQFLAETGFTPGEYRTRQRIQHAKTLLNDPRRSITEIAHELGYSSSQYFATVFKKMEGLSPSEFRTMID